ncbi:hypothetical protein JOM56_001954 [Amanita muscaria]
MVVGREDSDPILASSGGSDVDAHTRPGSRGQSHVSHANPASFPTTVPGVPASSCRIPVSSPTPASSRSAISPPLSSAADRLAAQSSSSSEAPVQPPVSFPAIPKKPSFHTRDLATLPSTPMGQGGSKSSPPLPSPPTSSTTAVTKGIQAALASGIKLKRVLVNRRKKSEDVQLSGSKNKGSQQDARQPGQDHQGRHIRVESCVPVSSSSVSLPSSRGHRPTVNSSNPTVMMATDLPQLSPPPPPPPPKLPPIQPVVRKIPPVAPDQLPALQPPSASSDNRNSIIPLSPGIAGAVKLIYMGEEQEERKEPSTSEASPEDRVANSGHERLREKPREADVKWEGINAADIKEARRKSDSTMSYHTIRPGTTSNRTSRPVSMADSLQSNHTVKPVRLSALLTDVDFTMLEEDDDDACKAADQDMAAMSTPPVIVRPPPEVPQEVSRKTKNRRSLSLNLGTYPTWQSPPSASHHATLSLAEIKYPSYSVTEGMPPPMPPSVPSATNEAPKVVETSATSQSGNSSSSRSQVGHNLRGKLTSWTNPSMSERKPPAFQPRIPPPPPPPPPSAAPTSSSYPPPALRAISMTSSLAPAAGRAIRGAVGRMGRAIGINSSSSNSGNNSGYSSSSSPSDGYVLTRTNSNHSSSVSHSPLSWGRRRTPDAPSGAWSVVSSSSDIDHMGMPSVPVLGMMLRAPLKASGYVFGRELKAAVAGSAVGVRLPSAEESSASGQIQRSQLSHFKTFADRALPAVVVRCAQHIFVRGIQEEGLFRVNGRAKHVATIRAEFDRGADHDIATCEPVDLDPHAVASVFKAFFRELPEPVLTAALLPFFERIVEQEMNVEVALKANRTLKPASRGPGLPSGPRPGNTEPEAMKKPPSLSTLALPSFKDMPPPSNSLLRAIKALIAQLPEENLDLLRTLIDVMNITAENEGFTKMPLANLVLVFCPTVQMTPPLLRILCEARGIWHQDDLPLEENLAVARASSSSSEAYVDATDNMEEGDSILSSDEVSEESPSLSVSDYQASAEDSIDPRVVIPRSRPARLAREPQSTVYLDAESGSSASSLSQTRRDATASRFSLASSQGDNALSRSSTPPMSSSAESLATPASAPGQSSLAHLPIDYNIKPEAEQDVTENLNSLKYIGNESASDTSPVQFPSLPASSPSTSLPSTPVKRRSVPLLSMPHLTGMNVSPSAILAPSSTTSASHSTLLHKSHKSRKPSLQILLSAKGSSSSLKGISKSSISNPIMNIDSGTAPLSASDSSVSTPHSAMTAPQGSIFTLPPVIGTPLETSPLGVGMGFQITPPDTSMLDADSRYGDDETGITVESAKLGTPIADRYRTTSTTSTSSSVFSVAVAARSLPDVPKTSYFRRPTRRPATSTSSNHLDLLDKDLGVEEDWTRSVLIAADIPILSQKTKS